MISKILLINIEMDKLPIKTKNEIMSIVKTSKKRFLLENQILKIDFETMKAITDNIKL